MPWPTAFTASGGVEAVVKYQLHGQTCNNTLWFLLMGELGQVDWPAKLQELCLAIIECAVTNLLPGLSSQVTFESITATALDQNPKQQHTEPFPANSVGALGESLPVQSAATVTFYTPYVGRNFRGGNRVAGVPEANHALSVLSGVPIDKIIAFYVCLLGKFKFDQAAAGEFAWIIFSRKLGFTKPSTYDFSEPNVAPVTNTVVRTTVGSQNTRKLKRGV